MMNDEDAGRRQLRATLTEGHPLFALGYAQPVQPRELLHVGDDTTTSESVHVAEEVPVALVYNGHPHVVMMATPADLEDFGEGFTISEEIVTHARDIGRIEVVRFSQGIELQIEIPSEAGERLVRRARQLVGRTGCGLCGVETIDEALRDIRPVARRAAIGADALWRAEASLVAGQRWNRDTGSMHAAAWVTRDGAIDVLREDVGRHNALDKVLGALARAGRDPADGFVVMTSRASYELVQKVAVAGIPLLAAVSRPTGLAIRLATAAGVTLVGLLRGRSANVYATPEGLVTTQSQPTR